MASNYKFYRRPAIVIRSNAKSGGGYALQRQSDELYEKLMEAEAVIRSLQAKRRLRIPLEHQDW